MTGRFVRVGRQALVVIAAVSLVLGIPLALWSAVGWPLPTSTPDFSAAGVALQQGNISSELVVQVLAVVIWCLWAQLIWALIWEIFVNGRRMAQGVRSVSAPWVLGPFDMIASKLVSAVAAIGLLTATSVTMTALPATPSLAAIAPDEAGPPAPTTKPDVATQRPAELSGRQIEVLEGESLWSIAELMLGDGARSVDLLELNRHVGAPRALEPGMQLTLPVGALVPEDRLMSLSFLDATEVGVERGDTLWALASERLAEAGAKGESSVVVDYVEDVVRANGTEINDPDLIFPGQVLTLPQIGSPPQPTEERPAEQFGRDEPEPAPTDTPSSPVTPAAGPATSAPVIAPPENPAERSSDVDLSAEGSDDSGTTPTTKVLGVAGALLAAGALRQLKRRRRFRMAHRRPGTVPSTPDASLSPVEDALGRDADGASAEWLHHAMASLASRPIWEGEMVAQPVLVQLDDERVEVEFSAPDYMAGPVPWSTIDEGRTWRLPRSFDEQELPAGESSSPTPLLVTVADGMLLNLEALGTLQISGADDRPHGLVRSIVHELANSPDAALVDIRLCLEVAGVGDYRLVQQQEPALLAVELDLWLDELEALYTDSSSTNAYGYRISSDGGALGPVLVIVDDAGRQELGPVVERAATGAFPLSIITIGPRDVGDKFSVVMTEGGAVIEPWGMRVEPQLLSAAVAERLGALLRDALVSADEPLVPAVQLSATVSAPTAVEHHGSASGDGDGEIAEADVLDLGEVTANVGAAASGITVQVLGPIEVDGGPDDLTSQQLSLICHIACSPSPTKASIIDALWDGQAISESRLPNLLAETRAKIGRQHLPEVKDGRYRLHGIDTDLDRFERLVASSRRSSHAEVRTSLRRAMELVRGVPFTPPSPRFWTWVGDQTQHCMRAEAVVADTAVRLANLEREAGSPDRARWACEQGLLASPADETLVTTLVEVYLQLGKPNLARRLVDGWEDQISRMDCGEPSDEPRKRLAGSS